MLRGTATGSSCVSVHRDPDREYVRLVLSSFRYRRLQADAVNSYLSASNNNNCCLSW